MIPPETEHRSVTNNGMHSSKLMQERFVLKDMTDVYESMSIFSLPVNRPKECKDFQIF